MPARFIAQLLATAVSSSARAVDVFMRTTLSGLQHDAPDWRKRSDGAFELERDLVAAEAAGFEEQDLLRARGRPSSRT